MGLFSFKKKSEPASFAPPEIPAFSNSTLNPSGFGQPTSDFGISPSPVVGMPEKPKPLAPGILPPIGTEEIPLPPVSAEKPKEPTVVMPSLDASTDKILPGFDMTLPAQEQSFPMVQEPAFLSKPQALSDSPSLTLPQAANAPKQDWTKEEAAANEEDFELPDFNDEELKQLQKILPKQEKKPDAELSKLDFTKETIEPKATIQAPEITAPQKPAKEKEMPIPAETYLNLTNFFEIRDDLAKSRTIARNIEEEMFAQNYKAKLDNYAQIAACMGAIQDRLMLVESKLFENSQEEF